MKGNLESFWMDYLWAPFPWAAGPDWRGCRKDWLPRLRGRRPRVKATPGAGSGGD